MAGVGADRGLSGCVRPGAACVAAGAEFEPHGLVVAAVQGAGVEPVGDPVVGRREADGGGHAEAGVGVGEQRAGAERDLLANVATAARATCLDTTATSCPVRPTDAFSNET